MIIDIHTHIFPDHIAKGALASLKRTDNLEAFCDGTLQGTLELLNTAGTDIGVNLPTITNPKQFDSILRFACHINELSQKEAPTKIISFGGMHPDSPHYKEEMRLLCENQIKGIKIHPDYQGTFIDDMKYLRILEYANELGLIVITHAGYDPVSPHCVHAPVHRILNAIRQIKPQKFILAHMGNMGFPEEVLENLIEEDVYFDTAMCLHLMQPMQLTEIIKKHGAKRILFGTDLPWSDPRQYPTLLKELPLAEEDIQSILWKNAADLLEI